MRDLVESKTGRRPAGPIRLLTHLRYFGYGFKMCIRDRSYFRAIQAGDFGRAAMKVLADNMSPATITRLKPRIEQLHRLYQDVKPGDRYGLTYLPGVGTELALNGERKGIVEGADFAAAYFAI